MALALLAAAAVKLSDLGRGPDPPAGTREVEAAVETAPVPSGGDAADDPAIWVNRRRPERSTVIGTDKRGGIAAYGLDGAELQYRADGEINNVDLRDRVLLGSPAIAVAAVTNRTTQAVDLYRIDRRDGTLRPLQGGVATPELAVNGICMYRDTRPRRGFGFFVTGLRGEVEQWRVTEDRGDRLRASRVRAFEFDGSAEACVADERRGTVYFAEERAGIWRLPLSGTSSQASRVASTSGGGPLVADVEGLAIIRRARGDLLVASSQGNDSYATYAIGSGSYAGSYALTDGELDGAEDTDGIDVSAEPLGPRFPHGLFVAQDGSNDDGNQNFKLVRLCRRAALDCAR